MAQLTIKKKITTTEDVQVALPYFGRQKNYFIAVFDQGKAIEIHAKEYYTSVQEVRFDNLASMISEASEPITQEEFYSTLSEALIKIGCAAGRLVDVSTFPSPEDYGYSDTEDIIEYSPLVQSFKS